jgi:hypothetical protein
MAGCKSLQYMSHLLEVFIALTSPLLSVDAENDLVGLESLVDLPSPGTSTSTGTATALLSEERLAPKNYSAFDDLLVFTKARGHSFTPPQTPPVAKKVVVNGKISITDPSH